MGQPSVGDRIVNGRNIFDAAMSCSPMLLSVPSEVFPASLLLDIIVPIIFDKVGSAKLSAGTGLAEQIVPNVWCNDQPLVHFVYPELRNNDYTSRHLAILQHL